jgi:tetratricopeptide (TPR) repeat protein
MNKFCRIKYIKWAFIFLISNLIIICSESCRAVDTKNFEEDLKKAESYAVHENKGWDYVKDGQYDKAIEEYKKAIDIIENIPGENWGNVSQEEMDRINKESRNSKQIFSRYGLIDALEKAGQYEEALQNVEWLIENQRVKGKEELLKNKLNTMKQDLLQKINKK